MMHFKIMIELYKYMYPLYMYMKTELFKVR